MTDLEIINQIEKVRSKNNINWMNIFGWHESKK